MKRTDGLWDLAHSEIDLGSGGVAIVHPRDARVRAFCSRFPAFRRLLANSRNIYNRRVQPAVLIVRTDALVGQSETSIIAFRNVVALSVILHSRANLALGRNFDEPMWADTFDFHPTQVDRVGKVRTYAPVHIATHGEAPTMLVASSPYVLESAERLQYDIVIYRALSIAWRECYMQLEGTDSSRRLFRSLEVAYQAASVPAKNLGSINDYGIVLSLWVSALEILAWKQPPGSPVGRADKKTVRRLLDEFSWDACADSNTQQLPVVAQRQRRGSEDLNLVEWTLNKLYKARDAFLHGNPTHEKMILATNYGISLSTLAAMTYRVALKSYVSRTVLGQDTVDAVFIKGAADDQQLAAAFEAALPHLNEMM